VAMSFATLTADKTAAGSIKRWCNVAELDAETVLEEAQALLFQTLRVREMRGEGTLSMSVGDSYKALPADFLDPILLKDITNNIDLDLNTESEIQRLRMFEDGVLVESIPDRYAIFSEAFQFPCKYDEAATLHLLYYKRPALLASGNQTNFLTNRFPHLLRAACMVGVADFMKDAEEYTKASERMAALIVRTNAESDLSYRGLR
jgi:hypothetical protein